jgi:hypothetical protein
MFTKAQQQALLALYQRSPDGAASYLAFRRRAAYSHMVGCVMIPWCGMWIGIEYDGHTHS